MWYWQRSNEESRTADATANAATVNASSTPGIVPSDDSRSTSSVYDSDKDVSEYSVQTASIKEPDNEEPEVIDPDSIKKQSVDDSINDGATSATLDMIEQSLSNPVNYFQEFPPPVPPILWNQYQSQPPTTAPLTEREVDPTFNQPFGKQRDRHSSSSPTKMLSVGPPGWEPVTEKHDPFPKMENLWPDTKQEKSLELKEEFKPRVARRQSIILNAVHSRFMNRSPTGAFSVPSSRRASNAASKPVTHSYEDKPVGSYNVSPAPANPTDKPSNTQPTEKNLRTPSRSPPRRIGHPNSTGKSFRMPHIEEPEMRSPIGIASGGLRSSFRNKLPPKMGSLKKASSVLHTRDSSVENRLSFVQTNTGSSPVSYHSIRMGIPERRESVLQKTVLKPDVNTVLNLLQQIRKTASPEELELLRSALDSDSQQQTGPNGQLHSSPRKNKRGSVYDDGRFPKPVAPARQFYDNNMVNPIDTPIMDDYNCEGNVRLIRRKSLVAVPGTATRIASEKVIIETSSVREETPPLPTLQINVRPSSAEGPTQKDEQGLARDLAKEGQNPTDTSQNQTTGTLQLPHLRSVTPSSIELDCSPLGAFAKGSLFVTNGAVTPEMSEADIMAHMSKNPARPGEVPNFSFPEALSVDPNSSIRKGRSKLAALTSTLWNRESSKAISTNTSSDGYESQEGDGGHFKGARSIVGSVRDSWKRGRSKSTSSRRGSKQSLDLENPESIKKLEPEPLRVEKDLSVVNEVESTLAVQNEPNRVIASNQTAQLEKEIDTAIEHYQSYSREGYVDHIQEQPSLPKLADLPDSELRDEIHELPANPVSPTKPVSTFRVEAGDIPIDNSVLAPKPIQSCQMNALVNRLRVDDDPANGDDQDVTALGDVSLACSSFGLAPKHTKDGSGNVNLRRLDLAGVRPPWLSQQPTPTRHTFSRIGRLRTPENIDESMVGAGSEWGLDDIVRQHAKQDIGDPKMHHVRLDSQTILGIRGQNAGIRESLKSPSKRTIDISKGDGDGHLSVPDSKYTFPMTPTPPPANPQYPALNNKEEIPASIKVGAPPDGADELKAFRYENTKRKLPMHPKKPSLSRIPVLSVASLAPGAFNERPLSNAFFGAEMSYPVVKPAPRKMNAQVGLSKEAPDSSSGLFPTFRHSKSEANLAGRKRASTLADTSMLRYGNDDDDEEEDEKKRVVPSSTAPVSPNLSPSKVKPRPSWKFLRISLGGNNDAIVDDDDDNNDEERAKSKSQPSRGRAQSKPRRLQKSRPKSLGAAAARKEIDPDVKEEVPAVPDGLLNRLSNHEDQHRQDGAAPKGRSRANTRQSLPASAFVPTADEQKTASKKKSRPSLGRRILNMRRRSKSVVGTDDDSVPPSEVSTPYTRSPQQKNKSARPAKSQPSLRARDDHQEDDDDRRNQHSSSSHRGESRSGASSGRTSARINDEVPIEHDDRRYRGKPPSNLVDIGNDLCPSPTFARHRQQQQDQDNNSFGSVRMFWEEQSPRVDNRAKVRGPGLQNGGRQARGEQVRGPAVERMDGSDPHGQHHPSRGAQGERVGPTRQPYVASAPSLGVRPAQTRSILHPGPPPRQSVAARASADALGWPLASSSQPRLTVPPPQPQPPEGYRGTVGSWSQRPAAPRPPHAWNSGRPPPSRLDSQHQQPPRDDRDTEWAALHYPKTNMERQYGHRYAPPTREYQREERRPYTSHHLPSAGQQRRADHPSERHHPTHNQNSSSRDVPLRKLLPSYQDGPQKHLYSERPHTAGHSREQYSNREYENGREQRYHDYREGQRSPRPSSYDDVYQQQRPRTGQAPEYSRRGAEEDVYSASHHGYGRRTAAAPLKPKSSVKERVEGWHRRQGVAPS